MSPDCPCPDSRSRLVREGPAGFNADATRPIGSTECSTGKRGKYAGSTFRFRPRSEETFDLSLVVEEDLLGRRRLGQARHGHDLTADNHDEAGAGRQPDLAHRHDMAMRRPAQIRIGRE